MGEKLMAASSVKILVGGQPVAMAPTAQLTISEENDSTKDGDGHYFVGGLHKSWDISCEGLVHDVSPDVDALLKCVSMDDLAVTIYSTLGKMPRKMKKAHKTDPLRRTKWGRKFQNYIDRRTWHAQHAEMVVTESGKETLSAQLKFDKMERVSDMVNVSGFDLKDFLIKKSMRKLNP